MKKIILSIILALSFISPTFVKAASASVESMNITTTLDDEGNAHIKEIWKMEVNEGTEVYKVMENMGEKKIKNLKVVDENNVEFENIGEWDVDASKEEKEYKCGLVNDGDYYELCFGIGEYGNRTYTFEYDVTHFVEQYEGDQGFNFAFFSDLELDVDQVRITIEYPNASFDQENSSIYAYGYKGYVVYNSGKVVLGNDEALDYGSNKMQILMRINDGTFSNLTNTNKTFDSILEEANEGSEYEEEYVDDYGNYSYYGEDDDFPTVLIGGIFVLVALIFSSIGIWAFYSRDREKFEDGDSLDSIKDYNMYRDIPCSKDLFRFYYISKKAGLINDNDKGGLISAILLKWIKNGYIEFNQRDEQGLFRKKKGFYIDMSVDIPTDNDLEKKLLSYFKQAAGKNQLLETNEFENWCSNHYDKIEKWFDQVENHIQASLVKEGQIKYETCYSTFIKIPYTLKTYSLALKEEMKQVLGFKYFLKEMSSIQEKEVLEVKLWEEYLIFASILSMAEEVEKQIGEMCPNFVEESSIDIYYTTFMIRSFADAGCHAAMQASHASSGSGGSSSFSGGGGGFSGGGGGGVR